MFTKFGRWGSIGLVISTVFWLIGGGSISNTPQLAGHVEPVLASTYQQPGGVEPVSGGGVLLNAQGRPAAGAIVRLTNSPPDSRSFQFVTDEKGEFRFVNLPLTFMVKLFVSWNPFYRVVDVEYPRDILRDNQISLVLDPIRVNIAGKVVLSDQGQDQGVPGALVFAAQGAQETLLGGTDKEGAVNLVGVPLEEFGNPSRGVLVVQLPDSLTFGGRFEPGPRVKINIDLSRGSVELGTVRFRRLTNPEPTVRLAGFLYVRDSLDPNKFKGIEGLVLRAVNAENGQVVAETITREGRWSLTIPKGSYVFESPNLTQLGFSTPARITHRIEFSREDLQNGLNRFIPEVAVLETGKLVFTYPDIPGLPIEAVVLRVNGKVVDIVSSVQRDGNRYTVTFTQPLKTGDSVEVAVRIDGLLTLFSPAQPVEGGRP
jgi:hypothetical protein